MKKIMCLVLMLLGILIITGCTFSISIESDSFKTDYESLNGVANKSGKIHRTVNIDSNNPFSEITTDELLRKIEGSETFYVYFGHELCPWCRSVIEKAIEVAKEKGIEKIYYVPIWDSEGNEIVRDKYELKDGELVRTVEGCKEYQKFLQYFDELLRDYELTDSEGNKISTGEKRIYAPNFIYVEDGKAIRLTTGMSDLQKDSREELTEEMLKDEEELFKNFFK